ncbi:MAG: hypothetical protein KDJ39_15040 [Gammaproteobacteria bacterium]|nr:hypothetical protein [Gammaproteobacteria bacterium]MCP5299432.1 hypothetical protein [Chromatiaceae bacterium]
MTDVNPDYLELDKEMNERALDSSPIELLERIKIEGRVWEELSEEYGVNNPDPPWRVSLESTCDQLAGGYWAPFNVCLPKEERESPSDDKVDAIERRWEEDDLVAKHYADVPFPERQLLALAHTLVRRGIMTEQELAAKMKSVSDRLNMVDGAYEDEELSNPGLANKQGA